MIKQFKKFIKKKEAIYIKLVILNKIGVSSLLINFIFQRIFRKNSKFNIGVNFTSSVISPHKISLHKDVSTLSSFALSGGCYIQSLNGISIGKNFLFAYGVKIISSNHDFFDKKKIKKNNAIKIGNDVWLGANSVILPGVELGDSCIVGAGSVVTKSFKESNLIIAGNPAKIIKRYK